MKQIGHLFVLLASFSAPSWMTALADTVTAHPSGLWLSLSPPHNTFARGELASLICSLPEGQRATGFYFYAKRGGVLVMYGQQAENILEVSTKYLETNKTFVCAYLGEKSSGGLFLSSLSNEVVLSITDLPRAPVFSVSPKKDVYTSGESVELKCSSSETRNLSRTQFFRDHQDLHSVKPSSPSSLNNVTHTLRLAIQDDGDYSCRYHIVESGREIASRESNSIRISVLPPPAPELSIIPPRQTFLQGQRITLKCSHPEGQLAAKFFFYEMKAERGWTKLQEQFDNTLEITAEFQEINKSFVCAYMEESSARQLSVQSNRIEFSITASFPPAELFQQPQEPVYSPGERVTLTCSAPEEMDVAGVSFYKEQHDQNYKVLPDQGSGPYAAFPVNKNTAGVYRCLYWVQNSRQMIQSPMSSSVSVVMTEHPRPPVLTVSPEKDSYRREESIKLRCSAYESRDVSKIQFFKDKRQLQLINVPSSLNTFTHIQLLLPQDGGDYSCKYHIVVSGREFPSRESNSIRILVLDEPLSTMPTFSTPDQAVLSFASTTRPPRTSTLATSSTSSSRYIARTPSTRTKLLASSTSWSSSSQMSLHYSTSTSSTNAQESRKSSSCCDPKSITDQKKDDSEKGSYPFLLPLAIGCGTGGCLLLLVFVVCIYRRKHKDKRAVTASYWKTLDIRQSLKRRCKDPTGVSTNLKERNMPGWMQPASEDWGILPKAKSPMPKARHPLEMRKADEDTDSGANFEFPEIDATYSLLSFPCSTFFLEENDRPSEEPVPSQIPPRLLSQVTGPQ
uniref:immunoglobulin superfamily member 1-like isoform X2 n=1 Tax=Podarcis muralis TaxID=64176 RepID=UPI0010A08CCC|nr:immunoglobulin superfamily member 1-like isoform X2 [Podarcis muralis]